MPFLSNSVTMLLKYCSNPACLLRPIYAPPERRIFFVMPLHVSKSVYKHLYDIVGSLTCAQVDSNWAEDGAHGEGTMMPYFLIRNAAQVLEKAAQLVGLLRVCLQ